MHKLFALVFVALLAGCVTQPKIAIDRYPAPRSIAIVKTPPAYNAALISLIGIAPGFHFTPAADDFYQTKDGTPPAPFSVTPLHGGGAIASGIWSHAENTQARARQFHADVLKQYPGLDLAGESIEALRAGLAARGIHTSIIVDAVTAPRLRWPAPGADPMQFPVSTADLAPVDADLLVQVSPVVMYAAPGPLNNYRVRATIGVAVYNGRSKEFLGMQNFMFDPGAWNNEFTTYTSLADAITTAVPAMRQGLLSLVPEIADVVSKQVSTPSAAAR